MHRLIVTSATYRQASISRPELTERDPRNLLLGRAAAHAAGRRDSPRRGPVGQRPVESHVGRPERSSAAARWRLRLHPGDERSGPPTRGPDRYRRGMYTFFYRSSPYPLFSTFDAPDFQTVCTRRPRSNTPLQALDLANDPAFLEMARPWPLASRARCPATPASNWPRASSGRLSSACAAGPPAEERRCSGLLCRPASRVLAKTRPAQAKLIGRRR